MLNGIQKKAFGKIPNISNKFYPTKTPVTAVMIIKIGKSEIPALMTQHTENIMSISFANRTKKYLDNEYIKIGKKTIQHITIELKHGFLKPINFRLKKIQKVLLVWVNNGEKKLTHE